MNHRWNWQYFTSLLVCKVAPKAQGCNLWYSSRCQSKPILSSSVIEALLTQVVRETMFILKNSAFKIFLFPTTLTFSSRLKRATVHAHCLCLHFFVMWLKMQRFKYAARLATRFKWCILCHSHLDLPPTSICVLVYFCASLSLSSSLDTFHAATVRVSSLAAYYLLLSQIRGSNFSYM